MKTWKDNNTILKESIGYDWNVKDFDDISIYRYTPNKYIYLEIVNWKKPNEYRGQIHKPYGIDTVIAETKMHHSFEECEEELKDIVNTLKSGI